MKKLMKPILAGILTAAVCAAFGVLSAGAQEIAPGPAPAELLGEAYNPFYGMEFPDPYTVVCAAYEQMEHTYSLRMDVKDTAEAIVPLVLGMLGSDDPYSVSQGTDVLQMENQVGMEVVNTETGAAASCVINDFDQDGQYSVVLYQAMADSGALDTFLTANFNRDALGAAAGYFDFAAAGEASFTFYPDSASGVFRYVLTMPDAEKLKAELTKAFADDYMKDGDRLILRYGGMESRILFQSASDGIIQIEQQMEKADVSFGSYTPPVTLCNFGFQYWEENGNCDYHDNVNGVYLAINRPEFGEPGNVNFSNSIGFSRQIGTSGVYVSYFPEDRRYTVGIDTQQRSAEYTCRQTGNRYVYVVRDELDRAKQIVAELFPDAEDVLYAPIAAFDAYIADTFGMTADELYGVRYE